MRQKIIQCHLSLQSQTKTDYIPKDIEELSELGYFQKKQAQKAIRWLLSKAPHSVDEIADHFEISPKLVEDLLKELTKANLVVKLPGQSSFWSSSK